MTKFWDYINGALKSHTAGIGAGLALIVADLSTSGSISLNQWYGVIGAVLGVGAAVYAVPNSGPEAPTPGA